MTKPKLSWTQFLLTAPYFTSIVYDVLDDDTDITALHPLLRAVLYYDIFDGEVSNGGVSQYFFNKALYLPDFERAPEYIAENPVFAPVLHLVNAAHAAWADCAADVIKARESDEWPEKLFKKHAPMFDALQTEFYQLNHQVSQTLCQAMVQNPHDYFDMQAMDGVPAKGVAHISLDNGSKHFRFVDGFPVGPNIFEQRNGTCKTVCFNAKRTVMECNDGSVQNFIHYPSQRSVELRYKNRDLSSFSTSRAFWYKEGLQEYFSPNGRQRSSTLALNNQVDLCATYYHANGQISLTIEKQKDGELHTRYWTNGKLNAQYHQDKNGGCRYYQCFAENGDDLAPNGTGKLYELVVDDENERIWFEGNIVNGKAVGGITRNTKYPDQDKVFTEPA